MPDDLVTALGATAGAYSVGAAATMLLQARQMIRRGSSRDVSIAFLGSTSGGYLIWLLYGLGIGSVPLIAADVVGLASSAVAVTVAVRLRGGTRRWGKFGRLLRRRRVVGQVHDAAHEAGRSSCRRPGSGRGP